MDAPHVVPLQEEKSHHITAGDTSDFRHLGAGKQVDRTRAVLCANMRERREKVSKGSEGKVYRSVS